MSYKKQLGFQKIICLLAVIVAALWFVYSLGVCTDIYEALSPAIRNPQKPEKESVPGANLYYEMNGWSEEEGFETDFFFNEELTVHSIQLILVSVLLFVTNTNTRRKYYIANYIAVAAYSGASIAMFAWAHKWLAFYKDKFLTEVDFEKLAEWAEMWNYEYTTSTWLLDAHLIVGALNMLVAALLIANVIWKIVLMRGEQKLLQAGKEAA